MRLSRQSASEARFLELAPVANVVLLLIFFFLLSWSFVLQPGIEVRLPVTSFPTTSRQGHYVISLKAAGGGETLMFFDEMAMDEAGLKAKLAEVAEQHFAEWITLNADESVPQGRVQQVAALAMQKGFRVTVATQRPTPPANGP
ncbi:MAG: biopolymer transporter ExbD [Verrucomicrobiae bacterium]|nr:biopolymer transporter ExbD [Verrucomicrobiae bacterium]